MWLVKTLLLLAFATNAAASSRARDNAWLQQLTDRTRSLASSVHPMRWLSAEVRRPGVPPSQLQLSSLPALAFCRGA